MSMETVTVASFEGMVRSTANRFEPLLDEDFDDVAQFLRLKVWKALQSYDTSKATGALNEYVFQCVYNGVKDLLKGQDRLNKRRGGRQLYFEEFEIDSNFSGGDEQPRSSVADTYLRIEADVVYFEIEDERIKLPSTLNDFERNVVVLLLLSYGQTEIARTLGASRKKVRLAHESVKVKMSDWAPSPSGAADPAHQAA